eukprot:gene11858-67111_t
MRARLGSGKRRSPLHPPHARGVDLFRNLRHFFAAACTDFGRLCS